MDTRPEAEITYVEVTSETEITRHIVHDLNLLIQQLPGVQRTIEKRGIDYMLQHGTRLFVAFRGEQIVGVVTLIRTVTLTDETSWVKNLVVHSGVRRQGIGTQLLRIVEEASRVQGVTSINGIFDTNQVLARQMCRRHGYLPQDVSVFGKDA